MARGDAEQKPSETPLHRVSVRSAISFDIGLRPVAPLVVALTRCCSARSTDDERCFSIGCYLIGEVSGQLPWPGCVILVIVIVIVIVIVRIVIIVVVVVVVVVVGFYLIGTY